MLIHRYSIFGLYINLFVVYMLPKSELSQWVKNIVTSVVITPISTFLTFPLKYLIPFHNVTLYNTD
jgi:hypothetical protein